MDLDCFVGGHAIASRHRKHQHLVVVASAHSLAAQTADSAVTYYGAVDEADPLGTPDG
ncbi:MAG: hypothetical protein ACYYKD_06950 [Rhodospirillales bacterium]